jgi:hypothetical protein
LVEIIILLAILGIIMSGVYAVFIDVLAINRKTDYYSRAYRALDSKVETIRGTLFSNIVPGTTTVAVPQLPGGQATTEITNVVDGAAQTDIVQATVTITWDYKGASQVKSTTFITKKGIKK